MRRWGIIGILGLVCLVCGASRAEDAVNAANEVNGADAANGTDVADGADERLARLEKLVQQQAAVIGELQERASSAEAFVATGVERDRALGSALLDRRLGNLHFAARATAVVQGTVNGDHAGLRHDIDRDGIADDTHDTADANLSFGLEIQAPVGDRGLAYMMLKGGHGDGLTDNLATRFGLNETVERDDIAVTELYYQHRFFEGELIVRGGMLDPTTLFDGNAFANDGDTQFLASGFVNAANIDWPDTGYAFGLDLSWAPTALVSASLGVYDGDGDWDNISRDVFAIAEIGFHPLLGSRAGHYRFYAWSNNENTLRTWGDGDDELGWGAGLSFDQELSSALGVYARYSYANEHTYEVAQTWSAGLAFQGRAWGRERDMLGFAIGQSYLSGDYKRILPDAYAPKPETFFELFYRWRVNEVLALTPDVQIVRHANADGRAHTAGILGMRAQLDF